LTYLNQTKEESKVSSPVEISESRFEEQKQPRNRFDSEKKLEIRNALYGHDIVIERASLDEKESSSPKAKQTFPLFNSRFDSDVTSLKTFAKTIHQYCNSFKGEEAHYQKIQEHEQELRDNFLKEFESTFESEGDFIGNLNVIEEEQFEDEGDTRI
jgi:hypothetical protein